MIAIVHDMPNIVNAISKQFFIISPEKQQTDATPSLPVARDKSQLYGRLPAFVRAMHDQMMRSDTSFTDTGSGAAWLIAVVEAVLIMLFF